VCRWWREVCVGDSRLWWRLRLGKKKSIGAKVLVWKERSRGRLEELELVECEQGKFEQVFKVLQPSLAFVQLPHLPQHLQLPRRQHDQQRLPLCLCLLLTSLTLSSSAVDAKFMEYLLYGRIPGGVSAFLYLWISRDRLPQALRHLFAFDEKLMQLTPAYYLLPFGSSSFNAIPSTFTISIFTSYFL
jgi:hypothetical protein